MEETEKIFSAVLLIERHNVLILGQAGTGKTTLIKKIYNIFKESDVKVKVLACTGIASTLLPDASTVHSFFFFLFFSFFFFFFGGGGGYCCVLWWECSPNLI